MLDRLTPEFALEVDEVNILDDPALYEAYRNDIPVVKIEDGRLGTLSAPIDEAGLRAALTIARYGMPDRTGIVPTRKREPFLDRAARFIGRHWLRLAVVGMAVYVGFPWLAPVFAALGWWGIADPIYTVYALTCHQLPERAGNLFGYQVAFCYRNTALYGGVALFGAAFGMARQGSVPGWLGFLRRPLPWWGLVLFLLPMAVDGITHMLGLRDSGFAAMGDMDASFGSFYFGSQPGSLNWWLRIVTGLLAALGAVWFAFPRMQRAVDDSEAMILSYDRSAVLNPAHSIEV